MTIQKVIDHLSSTIAMRAHVFGADDSSVVMALEMRSAVERLVNEVKLTLEENAHLADGEDCTLIRLKRAISADHDDSSKEEVRQSCSLGDPAYQTLEAERNRLKQALVRVREWGIYGKDFDTVSADEMAEWVDRGCVGPLPDSAGPCGSEGASHV